MPERSPAPDVLPLPPLPAAVGPPPAAGSLASLLTTLADGVIVAQPEGGRALVVLAGGRVAAAIAVPTDGGPAVTGPPVLDELASLAPEQLEVRPLGERLAAALPGYWTLPRTVENLPLRWFDGRDLFDQLAQPGRRGVVIVTTPEETGVAFFDVEGLIGAYSSREPQLSGLEALARLLRDPRALLHARLEEAAPLQAEAAPPDLAAIRDQILSLARSRLGLHSEPVERCFLAVPATPAGLRQACDQVRGLRLRLVNQASLDSIADQALALLEPGG